MTEIEASAECVRRWGYGSRAVVGKSGTRYLARGQFLILGPKARFQLQPIASGDTFEDCFEKYDSAQQIDAARAAGVIVPSREIVIP